MMKKLFLFFALLISTNALADNFKPYIGIDLGTNIADYNDQTALDDIYYSASLNAGLKIGSNFGAELFFTHSSTNELELVSDVQTQNHEFYYMAYGFDIFAYYPMTHEFDFFTSFGVANYKTYNEYDYIGLVNESDKISENDVTTRFGIGIMFTLPHDGISLLAQYQYIPINNELIHTMSEFSIGARMNF